MTRQGSFSWCRGGLLTGLALVGLAVHAGPARAQDLTLSLSRHTVTFASADPDSTIKVPAPIVTVSYRVRNNFGGEWVITLLASGDLSSGSDSIPISNVTWTATPSPPFQPGTMSATAEQYLAGGSNNVQSAKNGQVSFFLANSWWYDVGTYSAVFTFTLTAP